MELADQRVSEAGDVEYYSKRWNQYLKLSSFCSEEFVCTSCLRDNDVITAGAVRYDSLVLCPEHNAKFRPIMAKLNDVISRYAVVYTDLGLG